MCIYPLPYSIRYYQKPRLPVHRSENLEKAFRFMTEEEKLHLVNIGKFTTELIALPI